MTDPHTPRIDGDRLYGRGAYDMKAGLAAALIACREAARPGLAGDVVVAAVADEEHASLGVQEALRHVRADAAIVTEPTELAVAVAHKGFVWAEIEVTGRAAHGSRPHLGVDAIVKTGPILDGARRARRARWPSASTRCSAAGRSTRRSIAGGVELSSYPARCVLGARAPDAAGRDRGDVEAELDALLDALPRRRPGAGGRARTLLVREPFEIDAGARARRRSCARPPSRARGGRRRSAARATGPTRRSSPRPASRPSCSGRAARAPTPASEWVSLADTETVARTLTGVARRFCAG